MKPAAIIIPARWGSTRFPGKPLHLIAGKPLIQHVWERCQKSREADRVIVATDDMRIAEAAFDFGAEVTLTSDKHPTGTDRIAEVAKRLKDCGILVNVQGDEPFMNPRLIDQLIRTLRKRKTCGMATAACPFADETDANDPNRVKVVLGRDKRALYFSRSRIPYERERTDVVPLLHLGIYAYRRELLLQFVKWKPTPLEETEKLEQLRALENGVEIQVVLTKGEHFGVDTPEDAARAEALLAKA